MLDQAFVEDVLLPFKDDLDRDRLTNLHKQLERLGEEADAVLEAQRAATALAAGHANKLRRYAQTAAEGLAWMDAKARAS